MKKRFLLIYSCIGIALLVIPPIMANINSGEAVFTLAVVKFQGGGDWYSCINAVRNLLRFTGRETPLTVSLKEKIVRLTDDDLFLYPFIFINGHGDLFFDAAETKRLRLYLSQGGFLFCNDDYGLDTFFRKEMKKVFPELDFIELPASHDIYHCRYSFPEGLMKVHEHYKGPPHGYGLFYEGRMVCYYTFNSDIADGWEKESVHNDPESVRTKALQMGVNVIYYALTH